MTKELQKLIDHADSLEVTSMADGGETEFQLNETDSFIRVNIREIFAEVKSLLKQ